MPPGENLKGQWIAPSFIASVQSVAAAQDRMASQPEVVARRVEAFDAYKHDTLAHYGLLPDEWSRFQRLRSSSSGVSAERAALMIRRDRGRRA